MAMSFDHRAHLCLAYDLLVREGGVAAATAAFRGMYGGAAKYDEAITRAYFAIVADRMGPHVTSEEFLASNPDLLDLRVLIRKP